jgi:hypothetical protein
LHAGRIPQIANLRLQKEMKSGYGLNALLPRVASKLYRVACGAG